MVWTGTLVAKLRPSGRPPLDGATQPERWRKTCLRKGFNVIVHGGVSALPTGSLVPPCCAHRNDVALAIRSASRRRAETRISPRVRMRITHLPASPCRLSCETDVPIQRPDGFARELAGVHSLICRTPVAPNCPCAKRTSTHPDYQSPRTATRSRETSLVSHAT